MTSQKGRGVLRMGLGFMLLLLCAGVLWFVLQKPSHQRTWADDVAKLLHAELSGDWVTLSNVRNFEWRTETDYTPRWETRRYNLSTLQSADLALSYWMGPHIAHTLVSFGFEDGQRLVFSVEIRKEHGEEFSAWAGFFRQYEAVMIAADENDILRVRSNVRGEDLYLYPLNLERSQLKPLFLAYLKRAAQIEQRAEFYNTLTSNCTTVVYDMAKQVSPSLPMDYRLLASGYFAEYVYDQGRLTPGYTYAQLHDMGRVTDRAKSLPMGEHYSTTIRRGVPGSGVN